MECAKKILGEKRFHWNVSVVGLSSNVWIRCFHISNRGYCDWFSNGENICVLCIRIQLHILIADTRNLFFFGSTELTEKSIKRRRILFNFSICTNHIRGVPHYFSIVCSAKKFEWQQKAEKWWIRARVSVCARGIRVSVRRRIREGVTKLRSYAEHVIVIVQSVDCQGNHLMEITQLNCWNGRARSPEAFRLKWFSTMQWTRAKSIDFTLRFDWKWKIKKAEEKKHVRVIFGAEASAPRHRRWTQVAFNWISARVYVCVCVSWKMRSRSVQMAMTNSETAARPGKNSDVQIFRALTCGNSIRPLRFGSLQMPLFNQPKISGDYFARREKKQKKKIATQTHATWSGRKKRRIKKKLFFSLAAHHRITQHSRCLHAIVHFHLQIE